jgi:molecular chaperone DnaK
MVKDAEKHAEQDAHAKEMVEVRNHAESAVFSAEKLLRDFDDKLPEDAKTRTRELIEEVETVKNGDDVSDIQSAVEALTKHIQSLGASMYQQADADGAESSGASGDAQPDEDVIDAEFTDA